MCAATKQHTKPNHLLAHAAGHRTRERIRSGSCSWLAVWPMQARVVGLCSLHKGTVCAHCAPPGAKHRLQHNTQYTSGIWHHVSLDPCLSRCLTAYYCCYSSRLLASRL